MTTSSKRRGAAFFDKVLKTSEASPGEQQRPATGESTRPSSFLGKVLDDRRQGIEGKLEELETKYGGSFPCKKIPTEHVHRGPWNNRLDVAFDADRDENFRILVEQIRAHGGNAAPIFVREIDGKSTFELVYGERRWRACKFLGFEVLAIIGKINDVEAALLQHHENSARADISIIESAYQITSWDASLMYGESGEFAKRLRITPSHLSNLRLIGQLPKELAQLHPDIRSLNYKDARALAGLHRDKPDTLISRIDSLAKRDPMPGSKLATEYLLTGVWPDAKRTESVKRVSGSIEKDQISLPYSHLSDADRKAFFRLARKLAKRFNVDLTSVQ